MSLATREKWIEAGKILASDATYEVVCPECDKETLKVEDIHNDQNPVEIIERMIYCPLCEARQFILRPGSKK
jgi:Zn finger protein HypA/HybF involved in hydrogenase expression